MKKTIIALFVLLLPIMASAQTTCVDRTGQVVMNGWKYTVQTAGTTTDRQRIAELERDGWTVTGFGGNGTSIRIYAKCKVDTPPDPIPPPPPPPALSLTCPATQTVQAVDDTGIAVQYPAPTSSGGVAPVTITAQPTSGSKFPVGTTQVVGRATDSVNQVASCSFTITVTSPPPPPPSPGGLTFLFSNGWQNRTELGATLNGLLDRDVSVPYDRTKAWADFGPAFNPSGYPAQIVNGVGPRGTMSRLLQVTFPPDGTQNGPDFRIIQDYVSSTDVYVRWFVKYSDNWVWAGADHKSMICGAGSSQDVYGNVRGNGNGGPGRVAIHVIPSDTVLSDYSTNVSPGVWHLMELHIVSGTNGKIEAKLDGRQLNLTVEAGTQVNPNNLNTGGAKTYCKVDTTYNAYSYPSGLGLTMQTWFDDVAVARGGWIGNLAAPLIAKPATTVRQTRGTLASPGVVVTEKYQRGK